MQITVLQRLDIGCRCALPALLTLVLALINVIPLQAPGFAPVAPTMVLASLYYWAIYRPTMTPLWAVFLIGLFEDIVTGAPMGVNAAIYLIAFGLVAGQRRVFLGKSFGVVWWGFMLVAGAAEALRWVLISALGGLIVDPMPGLFTYISSIAIYPVLSLLLAALHRILPMPGHP